MNRPETIEVARDRGYTRGCEVAFAWQRLAASIGLDGLVSGESRRTRLKGNILSACRLSRDPWYRHYTWIIDIPLIIGGWPDHGSDPNGS